MTADPAALSSRLHAIAADPTWPGWLRAEAKHAAHAGGIDPPDLSDAAIREALSARVQERGERVGGVDETPLLRARLAELEAQVRAEGRDPGEILARAKGELE